MSFILKLNSFLVLIIFSLESYSLSNLELMNSQLKNQLQSKVENLNTLESYFFDQYIPFQSLEFTTSFSRRNAMDQNNAFTSDQDFSLKFNLKSFDEMAQFSQSKKLTSEILQLTNLENSNSFNYLVYKSFTNAILNAHSIVMLEVRKSEIERAIHQKSKLVGLNQFKVKDFMDDLIVVQKLESKISQVPSSHSNENRLPFNFASKEAQEWSQILKLNMKSLYQRLEDYKKEGVQRHNTLEVKKTEFNLEKLNKEQSWSESEKLFKSFEIQRDAYKMEDSFKFTLIIPWIRFDHENRNREKALLRAKELSLLREQLDSEFKIKTKILSLQATINQLNINEEKFEKLRSLENQFKGIKDYLMLSSVASFRFDIEWEQIETIRSFYELYFDILKEEGLFGVLDQSNLLDPTWKPL